MAIIREAPKCPDCGEYIGEIHRNQSNVPFYKRVIGDTFIRWDWAGHKCKKDKATEKK